MTIIVPDSIVEIMQRWSERQAEWLRLRVQVDGAALAGEIVADLEKIAESDGGEERTLAGVSNLNGYSTDHLPRLIRDDQELAGPAKAMAHEAAEHRKQAGRAADHESAVHVETAATHGVAEGVCPECARP